MKANPNRRSMFALMCAAVIAVVVGTPLLTSAKQPEHECYRDPHVIISLSETERYVVEDGLKAAGIEKTAHAVGNGDQDIYKGDIALVVGSQELVGKQKIIFEADDPRSCAERMNAQLSSRNKTMGTIVPKASGFVFVELERSEIGFRPKGALR